MSKCVVCSMVKYCFMKLLFHWVGVCLLSHDDNCYLVFVFLEKGEKPGAVIHVCSHYSVDQYRRIA